MAILANGFFWSFQCFLQMVICILSIGTLARNLPPVFTESPALNYSLIEPWSSNVQSRANNVNEPLGLWQGALRTYRAFLNEPDNSGWDIPTIKGYLQTQYIQSQNMYFASSNPHEYLDPFVMAALWIRGTGVFFSSKPLDLTVNQYMDFNKIQHAPAWAYEVRGRNQDPLAMRFHAEDAACYMYEEFLAFNNKPRLGQTDPYPRQGTTRSAMLVHASWGGNRVPATGGPTTACAGEGDNPPSVSCQHILIGLELYFIQVLKV
ncbi:hypothetical protein B0J14DRAFT_660260 [Halenospora varia]|nr:hypothetical protein B0J14DRAFT_660260 [Halenospora varia]